MKKRATETVKRFLPLTCKGSIDRLELLYYRVGAKTKGYRTRQQISPYGRNDDGVGSQGAGGLSGSSPFKPLDFTQ
ncbi:MAG: hypothetical protein K9H64_00775 [Bacteroidales bacterium]|nr:hypothetical protein [Bacteroidales bacterium]